MKKLFDMLQDTIKEFLKAGKLKEAEFAQLFDKVTTSSKEQDMQEHWDLELSLKVDVKSLKKIKRSDNDVNENFHWVEIRGVKDKGWLYGGCASIFAFETLDYWVIVEKEQLKKLIKDKVQKIYVTEQTEAVYKLYRRKDRQDILTLVKTIDLMKISYCVINKI